MTALPRASGVQLHVTSLPSGTLGPDAHAFVDWLAAAGQRFWQVLPLGPPDRHGSPYKSASAFAAWRGLLHDPGAEVGDDEVEAFRAQHADWIADWEAYAGGRRAVADQVRFAREWGDLRAHAARRGVRLYRRRADLRRARAAPTIAPTPSSSATARSRACRPTPTPTRGSCWGNPLYDWPALQRRALPLVGGALAAHVRARRPRAHRPLPRVRGLLGGPGRGARRPRRALGARPGARRVRRGAARARRAPVRRRGPRRHHAGRCARLRDGLGFPGMVVLQFAFDPEDRRRPAPAAQPPRAPGPLHGHPRQRHAARLVGPPRRRRGARRSGASCGRPASTRARSGGRSSGSPWARRRRLCDGPGPGRARARLRGAHERPRPHRRQLAVASGAPGSSAIARPSGSGP